MMKLTEHQRRSFMNFLGYGNPEADVWFLGMEEKLPRKEGKKKAIEDEFRERAKFWQIMDLHQAHNRLKRPIVEMKTLSQVWQWMAKLATHDLNKKRAQAFVRDKERFGSKRGAVFLTELSPVPASSNGKTGWTRAHQKCFGDRASYLRCLDERVAMIGEKLRQYEPRYVFAYGKKNWKDYCRIIFPGAGHVQPESLRPVRGTKGRIRIKRLGRGQTTIVLLPFLGNGQLSTKDVQRIIP